MDLATGQVGIFNHGGYYYWGSQPSYDPTGKWIIHIGSGSRSGDRITADASIHLIPVSCPVQCGHQSYSPDGTKIAFDQLVNGNMDIYVKNLVTGVITRVTTNGSTDTGPTWSPDGSRLVFASNRSGQYQIWTTSPAGGTPTRITHTATAELGPAWSH
jgi:Tol biopolymer transport system component